MKRLTMGALVVALHVAVVCAVVAPSRAGSSHRATLSDSDEFEAKNDVRRLDLEVGDASHMTLRFKVHLTRGMIQWRLLDPSGKAREEGEVVPGAPVEESRRVSPSEGRWTFEVRYLGATGTYNVNWQVR